MTGKLDSIYNKITGVKPQKGLIILFCAIFLVTVYILNYLYPLYSDDWMYAFVYGTEYAERINGISDIFSSQYNHYYLWGGRSVVHFIDQLLIWIGTPFNDILNTIVYVLFIYLLYRTVNKGNSTNAFVFILGGMLVWFFIPRFASNVLWLTGSANYLWGTFLLLSFMYFYISSFITEEKKDTPLKIIGMYFFGIVAGWTNENTAVVMLVMIFIFCFYFLIKKKLSIWSVSGLVGACIGCFMMMTAPGNLRRSYYDMKALDVLDTPLLTLYSMRLDSMLSYKYLYYILPLVLIYLVVLFIYIKNRKDEEKLIKDKSFILSVAFMIGAHLAFFMIIVVPDFPMRAMFGIVVFILISILFLYANILMKKSWLRLGNLVLMVLIIAAFFVDYYRKYPSVKLISDTFKEREILLQEQKNRGIEDIVFPHAIYIHHKFDFGDLSEDPTFRENLKYAKFYGVKSVRVKPDKEN